MDTPIAMLFEALREVRVPVVYVGSDRADGIAVELRRIQYLPADALAGIGAGLVLRGISY